MDIGTRLGPYEILTKIGEGGMGAVYKARDTRLDRTVAIKRSAEAFNERFEREAQAIAALNHPNICTLFDVGPDYLVMELVDGKPLSGPVPVDEAIRYAIQIASALDAAHRRGITHRDLKPANILVTKAGVKLLDFGLAKLVKPVVDRDATQVMGMTQPGMIMGTPQYMSPEQVEAQEADARSDIFSFGVILYELITGRKAFEGKTAASVMASVLREQPPSISTLVPVTPPALERIVKRCLEKDPDDRFQTARDLMHALEDLAQPNPLAATTPTPSSSKWKLVAAASTLAALAIVGYTAWHKPVATALPYQLAITAPPGIEFTFGPGVTGSSISPDGRTLAFCAGNSLWLRSLDSVIAKKISDTEKAVLPFWSPDNKSVGYFSDREIWQMDVSSGAKHKIVDMGTLSLPRGGTWNANGVILYSTVGRGIYQIRADGGTPQPVTPLPVTKEDRQTNEEGAHYWPSFLPDGDHFLYTIRSKNIERTGLYLGSLKNPALKTRLVDLPTKGEFVPASGTSPGYLLYARDSSLVAQPFDPYRMESTGEPVTLAPVGLNPSVMNVNFSSSQVGTIIVGRQGRAHIQMAWVDRQGKRLSNPGPIEPFLSLRLSPDGSRVALRRSSAGNSELVLFDFVRGVLSPLASSGINTSWSSDGQEILYVDPDSRVIARKKVDETGPGQTVWAQQTIDISLAWSPDGKYAVSSFGRAKSFDPALPDPKLDENAVAPNFSPDGKWLAYRSTTGSRKGDVFVQSFPDPRKRWQVSTNGGDFPAWRSDGKELFFASAEGQIMAVTVKPSAGGLAFDPPIALFPFSHRNFDVAPSGQKFLLLQPAEEDRGSTEMTVLLNWREALKGGAR